VAKPKISVVISAKNEAAHVEACLRSLLAQKLVHGSFEILFVDNNSTDNTFKIAQKIAKEASSKKQIKVLKEKKPGSPCARNRGAKESQGEILVFTDADCTFTPNWLKQITKALSKTANNRLPIAAVGGQTLSSITPGKPMKLSERYADALWHEWEQDRISAFPGFLPWAPTCNLAVSKKVFTLLGGFDESWNAGYDSDFCWRLIMNGFVLAYEPSAVLYHKRRQTLKALLKQVESYGYYNRALLRHYEKLIRYNPVITRKERLESFFSRTKEALKHTKNMEDLRHRAIDIVVNIVSTKGALKSAYKKVKAEKRFDASRLGKSAATKILPVPYSHLQARGWCYWKTPADLKKEGELVLFHPKSKEWLHLNESAWKILEVKASGGQSEEAARALGQEENNPKVLEDIDSLTMDFHKTGLL